MRTRLLPRVVWLGGILLALSFGASCLEPYLESSSSWGTDCELQAAEPAKPPIVSETTENEPPRDAEPSDDERIEQKLREIVSVDFMDTPLFDVMEHLKDKCDVEIQLDTKALEEIGVGTDVPISIKLKKVMLKSALRHMLRPLELVYSNRDGVILITTPEVVETHLQTSIYPVRDLIQYQDGQGQWHEHPDELIELIQGLVQPNTWETVGGQGNIPCFDGMLAVSQTEDVHEEIAQLLAALRKLPRLDSPEIGQEHAPIRFDQSDPQLEKISAALEKHVALESVEKPLYEVVAAIAEEFDVNILIDTRALQEIGAGTDIGITRNIVGLKLGVALKFMLEPLELTTYFSDEVLIVTTAETAANHPITMAYPVADLFALPAAPRPGDIADQLTSLIDTMLITIEPNTWDGVGGRGAMREFADRGVIVVSNTAEVQAVIQKLLSDMRAAKKKQPAGPVMARPAEDEMLVIGYELTYDPPAKNSNGESVGPEPEHIDTRQLAEMIRTVVAPESWQENKQAYISSLTDRLLVRQEKRVHREIEKLLNQLGLRYISGARR